MRPLGLDAAWGSAQKKILIEAAQVGEVTARTCS
jgi:hypothetical protein